MDINDIKDKDFIDELITKELSSVELPEKLMGKSLLSLIENVEQDALKEENSEIENEKIEEQPKVVELSKSAKTPWKKYAPFAYAAAFAAVIGSAYMLATNPFDMVSESASDDNLSSAATMEEAPPQLATDSPEMEKEAVPTEEAETNEEAGGEQEPPQAYAASPRMSVPPEIVVAESFEEFMAHIEENSEYSYMYEEPLFEGTEGAPNPGTGGGMDDGAVMEDIVTESKPNPSIGGGATAEDFSTTNNQEEAVDEGDIVKTDGRYIYRVDFEGMVVISDPDSMQMVSWIDPFEHAADHNPYTIDIFVNGDNLALIYNGHVENEYDYNSVTGVMVFDISDITTPKLKNHHYISGGYNNSRMVGDTIYMITSDFLPWIDDFGTILPEDILPYFGGKDGVMPISLSDMFILPEQFLDVFTSVTAVSLSSGETSVKGFLGSYSEIYMSEDNLYLVSARYSDEANITKVSLDGVNIMPVANGTVEGYTESQFSMDEHEGNFRIATTSRDMMGNTSNNLYILDETLTTIGEIENMARGERIYSVRFMGDMGYIVTFRETDPLFAIDLSDPKNPQVLGELKIPGFSEYMHPIDDETLIGIGEETMVDVYGNVIGLGLKLSLFDVSDPENPTESHKYLFGDNTYSYAMYDHKAFYYNADKGIIAFPFEDYSVGDDIIATTTASNIGEAVASTMAMPAKENPNTDDPEEDTLAPRTDGEYAEEELTVNPIQSDEELEIAPVKPTPSDEATVQVSPPTSTAPNPNPSGGSNEYFMGYVVVAFDKEGGFEEVARISSQNSYISPDRALHIGEYFFTSSQEDLHKYSLEDFEYIASLIY